MKGKLHITGRISYLLLLAFLLCSQQTIAQCTPQEQHWNNPTANPNIYEFSAGDYVTGLPSQTLNGSNPFNPLVMWEVYDNLNPSDVVTAIRLHARYEVVASGALGIRVGIYDYSTGTIGSLITSSAGLDPLAFGFGPNPSQADLLVPPATLGVTDIAVFIEIAPGDPADAFQVMSTTNGQGLGGKFNLVESSSTGGPLNYASDLGIDFDLGVYPILSAGSPFIAYDFSQYCQNSGFVIPTQFIGSNLATVDVSPSGLSFNAGNGRLNTTNATPGTYTITITDCYGLTYSTTVTILPQDSIDDLPDQVVFDGFRFPPITGNNAAGASYYSGSNGSGTQFMPGDELTLAMTGTSTQTYYIYKPGLLCLDQESFTLTIVESEGVVGINTDNPQAILHVAPSGDPNIPDGMILPRVDELPTGLTTVHNGMLVYTTGNGSADNALQYYDASTDTFRAMIGLQETKTVIRNAYFPDDFEGVQVVTQAWGTTYTVPAGKNLYVTGMHSMNATLQVVVNGTAVVFEGPVSSRSYEGLSVPLLLGAGDTISALGTPNGSGFTGFLLDAQVEPLHITQPSYTVPVNKTFVILGVYGTSATDQLLLGNTLVYRGRGNNTSAYSGSVYHWRPLIQPLVADAGQVVNMNGLSTVRGYLVNKQ